MMLLSNEPRTDPPGGIAPDELGFYRRSLDIGEAMKELERLKVECAAMGWNGVIRLHYHQGKFLRWLGSRPECDHTAR